jgi:hypothetical protein
MRTVKQGTLIIMKQAFQIDAFCQLGAEMFSIRGRASVAHYQELSTTQKSLGKYSQSGLDIFSADRKLRKSLESIFNVTLSLHTLFNN